MLAKTDDKGDDTELAEEFCDFGVRADGLSVGEEEETDLALGIPVGGADHGEVGL